MTEADGMLREHDFRGGVRGKYAGRVCAGSNVVVLDPDVARVFPDSKSVNDALRALVKIAKRPVRPTRRRKKAAS